MRPYKIQDAGYGNAPTSMANSVVDYTAGLGGYGSGGTNANGSTSNGNAFNPIAGLGSIGEAGYGLYQLLQGNSDINTPRPLRTTDPNILQNQKIAQSIASQGLPDSAKNAYTENINRALGSGINAILEGGGDINMISSLVGGATGAYKNLAAQDANQKLANQQVELDANQNVANQNEMNWNWNTAQPYLQKYAKGSQETNSGVGDIFKGLASAATTLAPLALAAL